MYTSRKTLITNDNCTPIPLGWFSKYIISYKFNGGEESLDFPVRGVTAFYGDISVDFSKENPWKIANIWLPSGQQLFFLIPAKEIWLSTALCWLLGPCPSSVPLIRCALELVLIQTTLTDIDSLPGALLCTLQSAPPWILRPLIWRWKSRGRERLHILLRVIQIMKGRVQVFISITWEPCSPALCYTARVRMAAFHYDCRLAATWVLLEPVNNLASVIQLEENSFTFSHLWRIYQATLGNLPNNTSPFCAIASCSLAQYLKLILRVALIMTPIYYMLSSHTYMS